jgi:hypothetical protein
MYKYTKVTTAKVWAARGAATVLMYLQQPRCAACTVVCGVSSGEGCVVSTPGSSPQRCRTATKWLLCICLVNLCLVKLHRQ